MDPANENLSHLNDRLSAAEAEVKDLAGKIFMPFHEIKMLTDELRNHRQTLLLPMKQEVRHEHHLSKPVLACAVLFLMVVGLLSLECYTWQEVDKHKQNDMKYQVDSLDFRKQVLQLETIKQEQFEDFQRVQEKQEEIKGLQQKWNWQPETKSN